MRRFSFLCRDPIISEASIPEYAIFPVHTIMKPILENRADRKASMSDCKDVKKIAAILSM